MELNIGLSLHQRDGVNGILEKLVADEYVLYTKLRNYHWNVTGPHFAQLHLLFEKQYDEVDDIIDDAAERIRALGGSAPGTLAEFQKLTRLKEEPGVRPAAEQMIGKLVADHEALIRSLRADLKTAAGEFGDDGTADFLTGLMEKHEKMAWLLRAHLG